MTARVVITAAGVFSALGHGLEPLLSAWAAGASGIRPLTVVDEPWTPWTRGGEIPDWTPRLLVDRRNRKHLKVMSRPVQIGVAAARAAFLHREAAGPIPHPRRRGAFVGAGLHVDDTGDYVPPLKRSYDEEGRFELRRWAVDGIPVLNPLWLIKGLSNNVLAFTSLFRDLRGVNDNLCEGEVAGLIAVAEATYALREGRCDLALAGGYGTYLTLEDMVGIQRLGDRPAGWLPGEGAAFFVLERRGDALAAGAPVLAEVLGVGTAAPGGDAAGRALRDAGLTGAEVDVSAPDPTPRLGNCHGGHGALMLALALGLGGQTVSVALATAGESSATVLLGIP